jgi:translocation and assembly module TamA
MAVCPVFKQLSTLRLLRLCWLAFLLTFLLASGMGCSTLPNLLTGADSQTLPRPTLAFRETISKTEGAADQPRTQPPKHYRKIKLELAQLERKLEQALTQQYQQFASATLTTVQRQQATAYRETLEKVLLAEGYYAHHIQRPIHLTEGTRHHWIVSPGVRYKIGNISVLPEPSDFELREVLPRNLHLLAPLRAEVIFDAETALETAIDKNRCQWRVDVNYDITLDHSTARADIVFHITPSEPTTIGNIHLEGLIDVPKNYLETQLTLKNGDCFKRSAVRRARLNLLSTGLVSQVDATLTHDRTRGEVDVTLKVRERLHRSIQASVGYSIDEKGTISAGWTHRNFRKKANRLALNARYSDLLQSARLHWTQPHVLSSKQNFIWQLDVENEQIDAFDARNRMLALRSEHQLKEHLLASIGLNLFRSDVIEQNIGKHFEFLSAPLELTYDRRDDLLDARTGWLSFIKANTFFNLRERNATFQKLSLGIHHYISYTIKDQPLTLASRVFLAGFTHKGTDQIPATEKYFAGGGGSVRGFAYKSLGPRSDFDGSPEGGFSMLELSVELRYRLTQQWGAVLFVDAGNTWPGRTPDLSESLPQSAGLGARFFTGFVPVRLDIAFPTYHPGDLPNLDADDYQLYISIGQSF